MTANDPRFNAQVEHLAKTLDKSPDEIRRALANLQRLGLIQPVEA